LNQGRGNVPKEKKYAIKIFENFGCLDRLPGWLSGRMVQTMTVAVIGKFRAAGEARFKRRGLAGD
jgi:hypothetical protein